MRRAAGADTALVAAPAELPRVPVGPELDNRRVAAALLDLAVPVALALLVTLAGLELTVPMLIAVAGWTLFYFFALESNGGQTLGKRLMGVRVVRPDGGPADLRQVAIRTVVRIADGHLVGLIAMLATGERRQRLGDLAAGTVVTHADAVPAEDGARRPSVSPTAPTAILPPGRDDLPAGREDLPFGRDDLPPGRVKRPGAPLAVPGERPVAANPAPVTPAIPPPLAAGPDLSAYSDRDPVVEPLGGSAFDEDREPVVEPLAAETREIPAHDDAGPMVKPVETISAIDQVMQEAEERHRG